MRKPANFENTSAYGNFEPLELGGHICTICKVAETRSRAGRDMVEIWLDIAEGPQKGYYAAMWRGDNRPDKRWPCIVRQLVEDENGSTNRGYKTFLDAVKKSNPGFVEDKLWEDDGCDYLKGKLVGGVFGRRQYENQKTGKTGWITECFYFRDIETIRKGVEIPEDKLLAPRQAASFAAIPDSGESGDLPF